MTKFHSYLGYSFMQEKNDCSLNLRDKLIILLNHYVLVSTVVTTVSIVQHEWIFDYSIDKMTISHQFNVVISVIDKGKIKIIKS